VIVDEFMATNKPTLHLAPPGMPALDALIAMSRALTGRDPTPEELATVKAEIAAYERQHQQPPARTT